MFSDDTSHTESLCTPLRVFRGRAYKKSGKPSSLAGLHTARGQKPPRRAKCLWRRIAHAFISIKVARFEIGHTPRKFPASKGGHLPHHRISVQSRSIIIPQPPSQCKYFLIKIRKKLQKIFASRPPSKVPFQESFPAPPAAYAGGPGRKKRGGSAAPLLRDSLKLRALVFRLLCKFQGHVQCRSR